MKVCFETFGCRLNKAEALQMEADYLAKGWEVVTTHRDADLIVVRGCSVTSRAQRDCEKLIEHLKDRYPHIPVRVCGCLSPAADAGSSRRGGGGVPVRSGAIGKGEALDSSLISKAVPTRTARAYLKVQDGCAGRCSFCIVPTFRGASVSVPFDEVLDKARRFIDAGYHEIVVTGCNLTLYASQGKRLQDLVAALAGLSADCRIRLGSVEPGDCARDTVLAMSERNNVCRFLHVPVQSGSNVILRAMNRPYTVKDVESLVALAVERMPNLGLGCDLMTGFPGETPVEFAATRAILQRLPFSKLHVFPFSARPGTMAVALPRGVSRGVRVARARELSELARAMRQKYARSFVGKTVEIVVEREDKCVGWTGEYLACEAVGVVPRKSVARISVQKLTGDRLFGRLVDTP